MKVVCKIEGELVDVVNSMIEHQSNINERLDFLEAQKETLYKDATKRRDELWDQVIPVLKSKNLIPMDYERNQSRSLLLSNCKKYFLMDGERKA